MKKLALLVENNDLMRLGLRELLNGWSSEWDIISLGLKDIRNLADADLTADFVVLGLPLDPQERDEAVRIVEESLQPQRTLLLAEPSAPWSPADSGLATSVYACIEKHASADALLAALQLGMRRNEERLGQGGAILHEKPWPAPLQVVDHTPVPDSMRCDANLLRLTPRQHEVLKLLACGHPIKTVARMMAISTATAKAHTASLYRQLKVNSRDEAVHIARLKGALPH